MYRKHLLICSTIIILLLADRLNAQDNPNNRPWWFGFEMGIGQLRLARNQTYNDWIGIPLDQFERNKTTFVMGFTGGCTLYGRTRIGLELSGWLLEGGNLHDATVGEGVSNLSFVVDAFPSSKAPLFFRGGMGIAFYENNHLGQLNSSGFSWNAGFGYEFRLREKLGLAPVLRYSSGSLGDAQNNVTVLSTGERYSVIRETGRRYSGIEFKIAIIYHFGKPKVR